MRHKKNNSILTAVPLLLLLTACSSGEQQNGEKNYPEPASPGATLLVEKCSTCHGAPLPSSRPANLWPGIVNRMQDHMRQQGYQTLNNEQLGVLMDYLQKHSSG
jgi:hypothetical protein